MKNSKKNYFLSIYLNLGGSEIIFFLFFFSCSLFSQNIKDTGLAALNSKENKYKNSVLLKCHFASNTKAIGLKYTGVVVLKKHSKCAVGFSLASEKIWATENLVIPTNYKTNVFFGIVGLDFRYKINEQLFFQPEFSFLIGKEQLSQLISTPASYNQYGFVTSYNYSENNTEHIILGGHLEQHLFYYPKQAKNLTLGISLFERFLNAKYYEEDFGICGYIGINF